MRLRNRRQQRRQRQQSSSGGSTTATISSMSSPSLPPFVVLLHHRARACCHSLFRALLASCRHWQRRRRDGRRTVLSFDDIDQEDMPRVVEIGRLIAEGGFSYVYEASLVSDADAGGDDDCNDNDDGDDDDDASAVFDDDNYADDSKRKYALKRINCADNRELVAACRREADAHRRLRLPSRRRRHPNLLDLLGIKFVNGERGGRGADHSDADCEEARGDNVSVVCYMLFPYVSHSLRGEITERNILMPSSSNNYTGCDNDHHRGRGILGPSGRGSGYGGHGGRRRIAFSTREVLHLFGGILDGLIAIHDANMSHRDVKIENVMLRRRRRRRGRGYDDDDDDPEAALAGRRGGGGLRFTPVLVDLGSSGPLTVSIDGGRDASSSSLASSQRRRRALLSIAEEAASHTTMAYRPPELFEGGMMTTTTMTTTSTMIGVGEMEEEGILDYGKVDVWSLGCVLFGIMHGASPYEVEFPRTANDDGGSRSDNRERQYGHVRIVECSRLKILGDVPLPPWATSASSSSSSSVIGGGGGLTESSDENDDDSTRNDAGGIHCPRGGEGTNGKYPMSLYGFVRYMAHHDRMTRPSVHEVAARFGELHFRVLGERWISHSDTDSARKGGHHSIYDDFDSLISSRGFV